jgi:uncharacterized protein YggE
MPRIAPKMLLLLALSATPALADGTPAQRLLTVSGQGEVKAVPDQAELSTGVATQGRDAASALSANARAMSAVLATLRRAGIPDKDIQTSNVAIAPQYADQKPGATRPPRIIGYEVTNTVSVTVEGLDKLGPTIDALVASGANQIEGPNFSIADPKPLLAKAREEAVKDAMARAETYARAAGVTLGPITSIGEGSEESTVRPMGRAMLAGVIAPNSTPVAAGQMNVSANVSITWEIR